MPQSFDKAFSEADTYSETSPSGLEPELGGDLRGAADRTGFEPELGGVLRQQGVYVDELTCIGCRHCAHVARNTFYIEPDYGRARAIKQDGDTEDVIQEAIDTCPVDCIHWVDYTELKQLEKERQHQVIPIAGFPVDKAMARTEQRKRMKQSDRSKSQSSHPDS
ncbi:MAG: ferredoxin [Leptolyngbya sp. SIOISBB]|nr:ferredoxin [Leptolyngbya sp. SIOISBB]